MTEVQQLQFEILCRLDKVCRKHGLIYYLAYGTCIGAIRNKGFIPWDHDIDVLMPIEDAMYLESLQTEFGNQYLVTSYRTDSSYAAVNMRIVDKGHRCVEKREGKVVGEYNLAIDIYPFYNCPESRLKQALMVIRSHIFKMLVGGTPKNHGLAAKMLAKMILVFYPQRNRKQDIQKFERLLNYQGKSVGISDYYGQDVSILSTLVYDKSWFSKPIELEFECHFFYGPSNPDKYLTKRYGDYMTPTSTVERDKEPVVELI